MSEPKFSVVKHKGNWRPMLFLSLPVLLEETLFLAVTWTDWWLTGHYLSGDAPKAAMGVMGYVMWLVPTLFASVAIGATALVSRYVGGNDMLLARKSANQAMMLGVCFASVLTGFFVVLGPYLVALTQLKGEALEYATRYLSIVAPVVPFIMMSQISSACLRGAGDTVSGFVVKTIVVVTNVFVSAVLVSGFWFFPEMGWAGIALGTAIGHAVGGTILAGILVSGRAGLGIRFRMMKPNFGLIRKLLRIGIPGGFDLATVVCSQLVFIAIINRLGDRAAASHGLAVQIEALAWMPGAAFQVAAATMAGQFLGAKLPDRAMKAVMTCLWAGGLVMCLAGVVLFFGGNWFAYFFTGDWNDPTTSITAELLRIISAAMPCLAVVMIFSGALRGAGDTGWSLAFSSIGFFLVRIPFAMLLAWPYIGFEDGWRIPGFGLGIHGAWYAMLIDLFVRSVLIGGRIYHGGWKRMSI